MTPTSSTSCRPVNRLRSIRGIRGPGPSVTSKPRTWIQRCRRRIASPSAPACALRLLVYSGISVKMMIDSDLGADLSTMFMVQYEPGGFAGPHDHPLEEAYLILEGEVEGTFDGNAYHLGPGTSLGPASVASTSSATSVRARCAGSRHKPRSPRVDTPIASGAIGPTSRTHSPKEPNQERERHD